MSYVIVKMVKSFPILCQVRDERRGNRTVQVLEKALAKLAYLDKAKLLQLGIPIVEAKTSPITGKKESDASHNTTKSPCWNKLRSDVYIRDKGICWICNKLVPLNEYELGHLIDRCNGGQDDYDNLAVMHKKCNEAKPQHHSMDEHITWLLKTKFLANKTFRKFSIIEPTPKA